MRRRNGLATYGYTPPKSARARGSAFLSIVDRLRKQYPKRSLDEVDAVARAITAGLLALDRLKD